MNNYIKSPLNFTGGKYKLLPQILPLFPEKINTFVDLFGGGFNVGINVKKCDKVIYIDNNEYVVDILRTFKLYSIGYTLEIIDSYIKRYNLSKTNKEGYLALRNYYNKAPVGNDLLIYTLICYAFNNQIRFNSKGEYNVPFGKREFNSSLREKLVEFIKELHNKDIIFMNEDFRNILSEYKYKFNKDDFVYIDPPYLNSIATYNEQKGWTKEYEIDLLSCLDKLDEQGIKFALSNNLKYNNPFLDEWKDKYNVHYLNGDYSNCNYQKKDKSKDIEVLITNY